MPPFHPSRRTSAVTVGLAAGLGLLFVDCQQRQPQSDFFNSPGAVLFGGVPTAHAIGIGRGWLGIGKNRKSKKKEPMIVIEEVSEVSEGNEDMKDVDMDMKGDSQDNVSMERDDMSRNVSMEGDEMETATGVNKASDDMERDDIPPSVNTAYNMDGPRSSREDTGRDVNTVRDVNTSNSSPFLFHQVPTQKRKELREAPQNLIRERLSELNGSQKPQEAQHVNQDKPQELTLCRQDRTLFIHPLDVANKNPLKNTQTALDAAKMRRGFLVKELERNREEARGLPHNDTKKAFLEGVLEELEKFIDSLENSLEKRDHVNEMHCFMSHQVGKSDQKHSQKHSVEEPNFGKANSGNKKEKVNDKRNDKFPDHEKGRRFRSDNDVWFDYAKSSNGVSTIIPNVGMSALAVGAGRFVQRVSKAEGNVASKLTQLRELEEKREREEYERELLLEQVVERARASNEQTLEKKTFSSKKLRDSMTQKMADLTIRHNNKPVSSNTVTPSNDQLCRPPPSSSSPSSYASLHAQYQQLKEHSSYETSGMRKQHLEVANVLPPSLRGVAVNGPSGSESSGSTSLMMEKFLDDFSASPPQKFDFVLSTFLEAHSYEEVLFGILYQSTEAELAALAELEERVDRTIESNCIEDGRVGKKSGQESEEQRKIAEEEMPEDGVQGRPDEKMVKPEVFTLLHLEELVNRFRSKEQTDSTDQESAEVLSLGHTNDKTWNQMIQIPVVYVDFDFGEGGRLGRKRDRIEVREGDTLSRLLVEFVRKHKLSYDESCKLWYMLKKRADAAGIKTSRK